MKTIPIGVAFSVDRPTDGRMDQKTGIFQHPSKHSETFQPLSDSEALNRKRTYRWVDGRLLDRLTNGWFDHSPFSHSSLGDRPHGHSRNAEIMRKYVRSNTTSGRTEKKEQNCAVTLLSVSFRVDFFGCRAFRISI